MLAACVEHATELHWAPGLKLPAVSWAGLVAVAAGELLRKAAMVSLECRLCKSLPAGSVREHAELQAVALFDVLPRSMPCTQSLASLQAAAAHPLPTSLPASYRSKRSTTSRT